MGLKNETYSLSNTFLRSSTDCSNETARNTTGVVEVAGRLIRFGNCTPKPFAPHQSIIMEVSNSIVVVFWVECAPIVLL